ncbi:hypothetical protein [Leucobacter luti]|uniref:hypothetical protein n=1 Tax=Leucobacter luti TaxID=340320 RepID=UPI001C68D5EA|nr:hypothetical protein [Leucobacter luti]QYM76707.1 hypothetical protein K1X41_04660 [Leucobacter luti]
MVRTPTSIRPRAHAATAALALLTIALTGCSIALPGLPGGSSSGASDSSAGSSTTEKGSGSPSSQCQLATEAIDRVTAEAQQSAPKLVADALAGEPIDPRSMIETVIAALDAASGSITDPAVLTALDEAQHEWSGFAADVTALGAPDVSGLAAGDLSSLGQLQEYGGRLAELYTERLPALQESGAQLERACRAE